jgi:hypothetical protein
VVDLAQTANPFEVVYTVGALAAMMFFVVLMLFALRDANRIRDLPDGHPDRMIAGDAILNEFTRIMLAVGILAIGLSAIVTPPSLGSTQTNPSVLGVTLFVVLVAWELALILWGLKDLWFRRRLFKKMASVRLICADSTFEACPFVRGAFPASSPITPESLLESPPIHPEHPSQENV